MKKEDLLAIAKEAAKNIKTEHDLSQLTKMLSKITIEAALNAELDDHLGYDKNEITGFDNSRNGYTSKTIQTEDGQFEIDTPRDRNGDFEPQLVKKNQRRMPSVEDKVMHFYTQGLSTRDIADTFKDLYDADVSPALISKITDAVIDKVTEWQARPPQKKRRYNRWINLPNAGMKNIHRSANPGALTGKI